MTQTPAATTWTAAELQEALDREVRVGAESLAAAATEYATDMSLALAQRDQARSIAARLEGECAELTARIQAATALAEGAQQVLWPSGTGYPSGWNLDPLAIVVALAVQEAPKESQR